MCVISGTLLLGILAEERRNLYYRKKSTILSAEALKAEERQNNTSRWQLQWNASEKGSTILYHGWTFG